MQCEQARKLRAELDAGSPLTRLCQHAGSALLAAAADDLVIRMCVPYARLLRHWLRKGLLVMALAS